MIVENVIGGGLLTPPPPPIRVDVVNLLMNTDHVMDYYDEKLFDPVLLLLS